MNSTTSFASNNNVIENAEQNNVIVNNEQNDVNNVIVNNEQNDVNNVIVNNEQNDVNNVEDSSLENTIENTNSIEELYKKRNEIQEKIQQTNNQLEYVQTEMSNMLLEIQRLDDKINQYEKENTDLLINLQNLETSVKETSENLKTATIEYEKRDELLKERLVTLYEAGDVAYIDVLLSSSSLSDFLSRYYAMVEITEYDNELIDKVEKQRKIINDTKIKLENETEKIKELKAKAEQSEIILQNTKTLQEGFVNQLSGDEKKLNETIQQYKADNARIEAKIQELSFYEGDIDIQFTGGDMIWPVAIAGTVITSPYGTRLHPIQGIIKFHQGVDIGGTGYGAPVVAVMDGIVTYAGWLGSYGNCVMVYHGNGITTLYGHGQAVLTQHGAEVKQGDVIMQTGSTGNATGPHLHFEVRTNGTTANPLNFVKVP